MKSFIKFAPLGGVGEIGSNLIWLQTESESLLIDFGILFPRDDCFGINYLIPNVEVLQENPPTHIYFTHGHEDHIGAISHLIRAFPDIQIYCTKLTHLLIEAKYIEGIKHSQMNIIKPGEIIEQNTYSVEYMFVDHSIPETHGLLIKHKDLNKTLFYASDFKIDHLEQDRNFIARLNQKTQSSNEHYSFIDSTNILSPHKTPREDELRADLKKVLNHNQNVFITLFASNMDRLKSVVEIASDLGKPISTMGRSVDKYCKVAHEMGMIDKVPGQMEASNKSDNNIIIISGCQGDFRSALRRLSENESPWAKISPGDRVVFSSRTIPGNERNINLMINNLTALGAEIITDRDYLIHASGHPGQKDLEYLYHHLQSDYIVPIHGETFFLEKHRKFIEAHSKARAIVIENFKSLLISDQSPKVQDLEFKEPLLIHGNQMVIERSQVSQRRKMATMGVVFVSFNKKKDHFQASAMGLPEIIESQLEPLEYDLETFYHSKCQKMNADDLKEQIRVFTRRYFQPMLGYRPIAICHVH